MAIDLTTSMTIVRDWLCEHVTGGRPMTDTTPLITGGLLTSLQTLELVTFIEGRFGIAIDEEELVEDNFETVQAITALIEAKRR